MLDFDRAIKFFENSPTNQYDKEAVVAIKFLVAIRDPKFADRVCEILTADLRRPADLRGISIPQIQAAAIAGFLVDLMKPMD